MDGSLTEKFSSAEGGILPITNSILEHPSLLLEYSSLFSEWRFPGHGEAYQHCGSWTPEGCLHVEDHIQNELFSDVKNKIFVKWHRRSCNRPDCPVCYEKWDAKEADKIDHRLKYTWTFGKVIHVAISPSEHDLRTLAFPDLRAKMYKIAQSRGIKGGVAIFHPWREAETDSGQWEFRPHFHILGYGWIRNTAELYRKDGWIVKNILDGDTKRSVFRTAQYILSHCGISDTQRSITWFGVCSTTAKNHHKIPPMPPRKAELCPCCDRPLQRLKYSGNQEELIEELGEENVELGSWLDPSGWEEVIRPKRKSYSYG